MASCPKCGKRKLRKKAGQKYRRCPRCGPVIIGGPALVPQTAHRMDPRSELIDRSHTLTINKLRKDTLLSQSETDTGEPWAKGRRLPCGGLP